MIHPLAVVFLVALGLGLGLTALTRRIALRLGALDAPRRAEHKRHSEPTPTLGGLAVFAAFAAALSLCLDLSRPLRALLGSGAFIVAVGVLDDLAGVSAKVKLGALLAGSALLVEGGVRLLPALGLEGSLLATFLWIGLAASAFNGVDNTDGAAGGLSALCSGFTFLIAWCTWQQDLALVALALAGTSLGFLWFNFPRPRASIFLGDSGSFFLGFTLAGMLVLGEWSDSPLKATAIALTLLAVPLFDFLLILVLRGLQGRYRRLTDPITMCARDHTHHRLVALGLSPREALLVLYLAAVVGGSLAVAMVSMESGAALACFAALVLAGLAAAAVLARAPLGGIDERPPAPRGEGTLREAATP